MVDPWCDINILILSPNTLPGWWWLEDGGVASAAAARAGHWTQLGIMWPLAPPSPPRPVSSPHHPDSDSRYSDNLQRVASWHCHCQTYYIYGTLHFPPKLLCTYSNGASFNWCSLQIKLCLCCKKDKQTNTDTALFEGEQAASCLQKVTYFAF